MDGWTEISAVAAAFGEGVSLAVSGPQLKNYGSRRWVPAFAGTTT